MTEKQQFKQWFVENQNKYHHDLLNDAFYDQIIFRRKEKGYFVEIGALDGWMHSQSIFFEYIRKWSGVVVEPHPDWVDVIKKHRNCNIYTNAISDKIGKAEFVCNSSVAFSHLKDDTNLHDDKNIENTITVDTITLFNLLNEYTAPAEIDFVSIDVEGYELKILDKFFKENDKYKINLLSLEHHNEADVYNFFKDKPYIKIKNPYLSFLKIDHSGGLGIMRLGMDNYFYNQVGIKYDNNIDDLFDINFEHYYIHIDFLKQNPHLKEYLIYYGTT